MATTPLPNNFVGFMNDATSMATTAVRNNPANQAPVFDEGASTFRVVEENTMAVVADPNEDLESSTDATGDNVGGPVAATDADDDTPVYTLSGADAAMFRVRQDNPNTTDVNEGGQIEVGANAKLDYEKKKVHTVTLTADDGYGGSNSTASITVTIHVTDLDEAPMIMDKAESSAMGERSVDYKENDDKLVTTLSATDPERVSPIGWSLLQSAGGEQNLGIFTDISPEDGVDDDDDDVGDTDIADRDLFTINQNGELSFKTPRSYEDNSASGDGADAKNYRVVVQASDGGMEEHVNWFKVTVTVTDVEETGKVTWQVDPDGTGSEVDQDLLQFQPTAVLTAAIPTDPDGGVSNVAWQWYRSSSKTTQGTAISGATLNTYSVVDTPADPNDVGKYLRVVATYTDGRGPSKTASFVSENPVQAARESANTPPSFNTPNVERRITENSTGNVGSPITAMDADGDIRTYSVAGDGDDNARFAIDRVTGQLKVASGTTLNFESPSDQGDTPGNNTYEVTIRATDSSGADADATVIVTVSDVNEKPTFGDEDTTADPVENIAGMAADHSENADSLTVSTYTATDPEGGTVTLSLSGDDSDKFELNDLETPVAGSKMLSFMEMPDFEMPGDSGSDSDNIYEVTVVASDGELTAMKSVTVKVTDSDEMGMVELSSQDALIGVELTATLTDSDGGVPDPGMFTDQEWQWQSSDAADGTYADIAKDAKSATYTPIDGDRGRFLKAMVTYTDRTRDEDNDGGNNATSNNFVGFMNDATSMATTAVRNNPANQAPVFDEGASTFRVVEENTMAVVADPNEDLESSTDATGDNVGGPVAATRRRRRHAGLHAERGGRGHVPGEAGQSQHHRRE